MADFSATRWKGVLGVCDCCQTCSSFTTVRIPTKQWRTTATQPDGVKIVELVDVTRTVNLCDKCFEQLKTAVLGRREAWPSDDGEEEGL